MKKDIVLCGVGGQGILTIAVVFVSAAIKEGLNFRQSEVHGMSQRGGAVDSHVRISDGIIHGDLVGKGRADLLVSVEPMEALRHINDLKPDGVVITNTVPVKNIPDYPELADVMKKLAGSGRTIITLDAAEAAKEAGNPKSQNIALAGAAMNYCGLKQESLKHAIGTMFEAKGQAVVDANLKAFELGGTRSVRMEKI